MLRVIADDKIPFLKGVLEPYATVQYLPAQAITRELLRNTDALLIRTRTRCNASLLEGTNVKFIASATIGFDHIDTAFCEAHRIAFSNAPGCNALSVQQYILAALLTLANDKAFDIRTKTLGVVGVGNVGSNVARAARLLGMNVLLNDPPRARREGQAGFVHRNELLRAADIITLHVPLCMEGEDKTYHLSNNSLFSEIKQGGWLINTSRGEIIETKELANALVNGKLAGAILDVWENEPDIALQLLRKTYISTPHIAGYSLDGKANATKMIVRSLCQHFGLPFAGISSLTLPPPPVPEIFLDAGACSCQEIIRQAVMHTYPILEDNIRLKLSPESFEQQRSSYRIRREFPAFSINLENGNIETVKILEGLGFSVSCEK